MKAFLSLDVIHPSCNPYPFQLIEKFDSASPPTFFCPRTQETAQSWYCLLVNDGNLHSPHGLNLEACQCGSARFVCHYVSTDKNHCSSDVAYTEKHTCMLCGTLIFSLRMLLFSMDNDHELRCRKRKSFAKNLETLCNNHKEHQHLLYVFFEGLHQGKLKFSGKNKILDLALDQSLIQFISY